MGPFPPPSAPVLSLGATGLGEASSRRGVWGARHAQRDDVCWLSPSSRHCPTQARHLGSSLHPASSPAASGHPPAPHRSPSPAPPACVHPVFYFICLQPDSKLRGLPEPHAPFPK